MIQVGISGWTYREFVGTFYPKEVPSAERLAFYAERFSTVEVNSTFYHMPRVTTLEQWERKTPAHFLLSLKANRQITHYKRLSDCRAELDLFLERARVLGKKLGPVLFQLPPKFPADIPKLEAFLNWLPSDLRFAFEFRDPSWHRKETYESLRDRGVAFCVYDIDRKQSPLELTGDFAYIRLHGPAQRYRGTYSESALERWARALQPWARKGDVFVYFDNTMDAGAIQNAMDLRELLSKPASKTTKARRAA